MDLVNNQGTYRRYNQRKGKYDENKISPAAILDQLEYEISLLEDELEELKAYKRKLEENIEMRKKVSQKLELHKYGIGIVVVTIMENEVVFEFTAMVVNKCTKSYCMRIEDLGDGAFSVLKYYMPICMDVRGLLNKPEFQNNILKYLNHIHSCLIAYNDRKHQVMQVENSFNNNCIKIANTVDYRMLEITFSMKDNKNKQVTVVVVLKYEDIEVRPSTISVECKDINKEASEEIRAQLKDLQIYPLEVGLQLSLLKNESPTQSSDDLNNESTETSIESAATIELPQTNLKHVEVAKRVRGRGRRSFQQHSTESELETSEEDDQNRQKTRRGRGLRDRGRGKNVPVSKQMQAKSENSERGVSRRGRGRNGRRGLNKGKTADISMYFERSNP